VATVFELVGKLAIEGAEKVASTLGQVASQGGKTASSLGNVSNSAGGTKGKFDNLISSFGKFNDGGEHAKKTFEKLGEAIEKAGKLALVGAATVGGAMVAIGVGAVKSYADYEQLTGGIETLFGKSYDTVMKYANNAYKTSGLSANEYMELSTSFAGSLLQGLEGDTAQAAEYSERAIVQMSDNANKMGSDMGSIQNAYQGFAKQNYTMLDNLKLGYGGTASEMARLVNDSGILEDGMKVTAQTVNDLTFDQLIDAIQTVQDEMGITGTTALEASETISGSFTSMKSAWENLKTGIATGEVADKFKALRETAVNWLGNIVEILPTVISGVAELIANLAVELPALMQPIMDKMPEILDSLIELGFVIVDSIFGEKAAFAFLAIIENLDNIAMVAGIVAGAFIAWEIATVVMSLTSAIAGLTVGLGFLESVEWLCMLAGEAMWVAIGGPIGLIAIAIGALIAVLVIVYLKCEWFRDGVNAAWEAIKSATKAVWDWVIGKFQEVWDTIKPIIDKHLPALKKAWSDMWNAIKDKVTDNWNKIKSIFEAIKNFINQHSEGIKQIITAVWNGIKTQIANVLDLIMGIIRGVMQIITGIFTGDWGKIKEGIMTILTSIGNYIKNTWNNIKTTISGVMSGIKTHVTSIWDSIKTAVQNKVEALKTAVMSKFDSLKSKIRGVVDTIKGFFNFSFKLPHIPMPRFQVSPSGWKIGDLLKGTIPSLSINWNALGGIFDKPTLFPTANGLQGVGEAGAEAVMPLNSKTLAGIGKGVAEASGFNEELMRELINEVKLLRQENKDLKVYLNDNTLVGAITKPVDKQMQSNNLLANRGVTT